PPGRRSNLEPPARLDQLHELGPRLRPFTERPQHRRGDRFRVLLLHAAHQHTQVDRFHPPRHTARLERLVQRAGDLGRQPLLHLQTPTEHLDEPRNLGEADDLAIGQIGDVALAHEGQQVVLAHRAEVDVLHDHHLFVVLDEHGAVENFLHVLGIARREVAHRLLHTLGRPLEALASGVLAQLLEQLGDQIGDLSVLGHHEASPSYWNRFLAVSTTVTRRSAPSGTAGARRRQNARASPSPVVTTPASSGTSSSVRWSTRLSTRSFTAPSITPRSTDMPVGGSGTPTTGPSRQKL